MVITLIRIATGMAVICGIALLICLFMMAKPFLSFNLIFGIAGLIIASYLIGCVVDYKMRDPD